MSGQTYPKPGFEAFYKPKDPTVGQRLEQPTVKQTRGRPPRKMEPQHKFPLHLPEPMWNEVQAVAGIVAPNASASDYIRLAILMRLEADKAELISENRWPTDETDNNR